jgi:RecA-family ATPase
VLWVNTDNSEETHAARLRAIMRARGLKNCPLFSLTTTEFELAKPDHLANLTLLADDLGARVIVLDTLSGALIGIDENAAQQMTLPAAHLRALADTGLTVLAIHHPPKNDTNGSRGSSVLPNKCDRVYAVARDGDVLTVKAQKTRNTPPTGVITPLASVEADYITEALLSARFWDGRAAMQDKADDEVRQKIREALEGVEAGLGFNKLVDKVKAAKTTVQRAVSPMLTTGEVVKRDGPNRSDIYSLAEK